ncbi:UDP-N-acetylmuramoylalanine--D-glutamate ligase [Pseudomonas fluorescens]|uniref:UDP-N-acetylmuramoylalanine--D-glutamate ligase n=1 Tax=Pseudomonas fluorescens TaxID=294 RepID=A0A5E6SNL2_PSEFL|nr:UDP-N-acetylmuramoylalanine--D-glutamate ligase [Pseudomonas fluorescens]
MSLIASDHFRIVVGLGKSGMSLVRFLANRGTSFAVADTRENPPELATRKRDYPHVEVRCGELEAEFLCRADAPYVSPGLPSETPATARAAARGDTLQG